VAVVLWKLLVVFLAGSSSEHGGTAVTCLILMRKGVSVDLQAILISLFWRFLSSSVSMHARALTYAMVAS
jgi:hypothetical protein